MIISARDGHCSCSPERLDTPVPLRTISSAPEFGFAALVYSVLYVRRPRTAVLLPEERNASNSKKQNAAKVIC